MLPRGLSLNTIDCIIHRQNDRGFMNHDHKTENQPEENRQLSAALMPMSESETARLLDTIKALQDDLIRLAPLFNGKEPVEAVTYTQDLLHILSDQINQVLAIKRAQGIQERLQNLGYTGLRVDYAWVHHLLSKIRGNKRRLIWAGRHQLE